MKTIQHLLFPSKEICSDSAFYFRLSNATMFINSAKKIVFDNGGVLELNTYFNSLTIEKWLKYTTLKKLSLTLKLQGSFSVNIKKNVNSISENIYNFDVIGQNQQISEHIFSIPLLDLNGLLYIELESKSQDAEFYGGDWCGEFSDISDVKTAIIFCTYKREEYIIENLKRLKDYDVFVVDNAGTLPENCCENLFRNPNLGGAGGFSRGMYEVQKKSGYSHIILMDDDVFVDPESVYRTKTLYETMKPEYQDYFIGGAMFRSDKPYFQYESGAILRKNWGIDVCKNSLDLRDFEKVSENEIIEKTNYNAWFFCAFTIKFIKDKLAFPLFFQWDDIEFAIRCKAEFIHLNGVCVWHEPFEKKVFSAVAYYSVRNQLIVRAVHNKFPSKNHFLLVILKSILRDIFCFRYNIAGLTLDGVEDFLRGSEWLKNLDFPKKHLEIMQKTKFEVVNLEDIDKIPNSIDLNKNTLQNDSGIKKFFRVVTLNGTINPFKSKKKIAIVSAQNTRPINFYGAEKAFYYNDFTEDIFFTQKDNRKMFALFRRYIKISLKFRTSYKKVCDDYKKNFDALTSVQAWEERIFVEH